MKFSRQLSIVFIFLLVSCAVLCVAAFAAGPPSPVLPTAFAGWQMKGTVEKSDDAAVADEANAPVLKEYGFQRLEKTSYARDDGRNLTIKAAVFADASGAYGAFTYYDSEEMTEGEIGGQAALLKNRVLFYQGNVLVDAVFDRISAMSAAQLRELAGLLLPAEGNKGNPPSLPGYLPKRASLGNIERNIEKNTTKYILGPVALDRVGSPLPGSMVDFKSGAEVVMGRYAAAAGDATLMLVEYPTPQIAAERLRQIDASNDVSHDDSSHPVAERQPGVASMVDVGPFFDTRTGPDHRDRGWPAL